MAFTAKDVQALREKTGCGMMDCKKALQVRLKRLQELQPKDKSLLLLMVTYPLLLK